MCEWIRLDIKCYLQAKYEVGNVTFDLYKQGRQFEDICVTQGLYKHSNKQATSILGT